MRRLADGNLPWLVRAGSDFRKEVKAATSLDPRLSEESFLRLSLQDMDINQLLLLDRQVGKARKNGLSLDLDQLNLAYLADGTTDFTVPALRAAALRYRLALETYVSPYNLSVQDVMQSASPLYKAAPDIAWFAPSDAQLGLNQALVDTSAADAHVSQALSQVRTIIQTLQASGVPTVVVQTLTRPADPWLGHADLQSPGSIAAQITAFNERLKSVAAELSAFVFDVASIADLVGRAQWVDVAEWQRSKTPIALKFLPLYADHVARFLAALRGKSRKCLVLDLDNTCWGGVIGDDGLDGIVIGQGDAIGEAHLALQHYALSLKARGVVLAICSKNEEAAAKLPFEQHPEMALRLDDIAVFVANWTDKASNLKYIAETLNIGRDALVFVDDNPAERARVRQMLPEVAVPELTDEPSDYVSLVAQAGYFEALGLTAEDTKRAEQYKANAARSVALEKIGNYDDYLRSLNMECTLAPFDAVGRARIAQLINKTNQFNLTTRRYTEADVKAMEDDPKVFTLQVRLTDNFGDNGMISVLVFRQDGPQWICDTWLMSCRVLGRTVEKAALHTVVKAARAQGANTLLGTYIPSAKNMMVADHFEKLGFAQTQADEDGTTHWQLDLDAYEAPELHMTITDLAHGEQGVNAA